MRRRAASFVAGAFLASLALAAAAVAARAGEAEILRDVKYLASDELEGRATGSPGGAAAADYVSKELAAAGLEPHYQEFEFLAGIGVGTRTALALDVRREVRLLQAKEDFSPIGFSSVGAAAGEIVFCGYGITAPEASYDDYAACDVKGKVALVFDRVPRARFPRDRGNREPSEGRRGEGEETPHHAENPFVAGDGIKRYNEVRYKAMNAREHGAAALLVVSAEPSGGKGDDPSLLPLTGGVTHGDAGILVADLRRSIAADLLARAGRSLDALQSLIDAELAPHSIALSGMSARIEIDLVKEKRKAANVIAIQRGTDPEVGAEAIVVGAHYDHLGRGEVGGSLAESAAGKEGRRKADRVDSSGAPREAEPSGEIHNGADDNASGTAALLEIARALKETRRTVVFAAFSGEEMGLLGSAHYAKEPPLPLERTIAMINMDMVGRLGKKKLIVGGMGTAAEWPEVVSGCASVADIEFTPQEDGYGPSDHSSFYAKEIPVLFLFTGAHSDYHKPSDDWDKIDYPGAARVAGFARELVLAIDRLERRPTYQKTKGTPHGQDLEPGRGPQVYLGTIPDYSDTDTPGVRLSGVREGSPGEKAGLRGGDLIVRFDGREVRNVHDYTYALFAKKPGDVVEIVVKRGAEEVRLKATLGRKGRSAH